MEILACEVGNELALLRGEVRMVRQMFDVILSDKVIVIVSCEELR